MSGARRLLRGAAHLPSTASLQSTAYCRSVESRNDQGVFRGGIFVSRDGGQTWVTAMGQGINIETEKADQWAFGPIAQYKQLLAADRQPMTVYAMNTSTGFHPPHHETVYRSDDGRTWSPFAGLPFSNVQRVAFDPTDASRMFVTTFGGSVWHGPIAPLHRSPQ